MTQHHVEQTSDQEMATQRPTNRTAIWSLVLSILTLGGIGSLLGIVLGFRARRQVASSGERGSGLALAGIVVGVITLVLAVGYWIAIGQDPSTPTGPGGGGGGGY